MTRLTANLRDDLLKHPELARVRTDTFWSRFKDISEVDFEVAVDKAIDNEIFFPEIMVLRGYLPRRYKPAVINMPDGPPSEEGQRRVQELLAQLREKWSPPTWEELLKKAREAVDGDDFDEAEKLLNRALALDPPPEVTDEIRRLSETIGASRETNRPPGETKAGHSETIPA
jgi:hypothetical protein